MITCNRAYSLFPQEIFFKRQMFLLKEMDDYFGRLLVRYEKHGWASSGLLDTQFNENEMIALDQNRYVSDSCKLLGQFRSSQPLKASTSPRIVYSSPAGLA